MLTSTILVQEPDYIGFRKINLPLRAEGAIYDGIDPYATPLGVVFLVVQNGRDSEIYVPRMCCEENGKTVYIHDLDSARYIVERNGFEEAQLKLSDKSPDAEAREFLRAFLEAQNTPEVNKSYLMRVCG
jgi:hypothetical protein